MSDYTTCEEGVTRRQAFQPCDKPAVAMRLDPEDKKPYPVCRRHCRENMVPLAEVKAQAVHDFVESAIKPEKIMESVAAGFNESVRELMAQVWEEGHSTGIGDALFDPEDYTKNPYRQGETE